MKKHNVIASTLGSVAEWYDLTVYGFLATVIAKQFFPHHSHTSALILAFGIFAIGFIARPIGGLLFGYFGDIKGRKKVFYYSILLMGIPSLLISILPTYNQIGLTSPILLITFRLVQGLACGGEFIGAIIFLGEHAQSKHRIFWCSFPWIGSLLGTLLASLLVYLMTHFLKTSTLHNWGWRAAFLLGGITLVAGMVFRRHASEPPIFESLSTKPTNPIKNIITKQKLSILCIAMSSISLAVISYLTIIYMPTYLKTFSTLSMPEVLRISTLLITSLLTCILLIAAIARNSSPSKLMLISMLMNITLAFPIFKLITLNPPYLFEGLSLLVLACSFSMVSLPAFILEITKVDTRYSSAGLAYNIALSIFGGTTPMVLTYLIALTNDKNLPAYYIMAASCISLIALLLKPHNLSKK